MALTDDQIIEPHEGAWNQTRAARAPAVAAPAATEGPAGGTERGEAVADVFRPADPWVSATGDQIFVNGDDRELCVLDVANAEVLRDMLDDVIASLSGDGLAAERDDLRRTVRLLTDINHQQAEYLSAVVAERDALRRKAEAVRALHARHDGGLFCHQDDEVWPCPTIQALDGGE